MPLQLAALGSSFAAGPGIAPIANKAAMRSSVNYSNVLASHLDARLTDLTVSGATLNNVLNEEQTYFGTTFPPQLSLLPEDVNIVTITAGGNDLGYSRGMMSDWIGAYTLGSLLMRMFPLAPSSDDVLSVEDLAARLGAVADAVKVKAPRAKVLLVEYITVFGDATKTGVDVPFGMDKVEYYRGMGGRLSEANRRAAESRDWCEVVGVADFSKDHCLGSEEPWVDGFTLGMILQRRTPLHPNAAGMKAVGDILYEKVKSMEVIVK